MASVHAQLRDGTKTIVTCRQFTLVGDEPPDASGTDQGPSPYELLLSALATCTTITLRLYADHKGIPLAGVDVDATFRRVDRSEGGRVEQIEVDVALYGEFDDAQRARLTQVAERCPVHRTLMNGLSFENRVAFHPPPGSA